MKYWNELVIWNNKYKQTFAYIFYFLILVFSYCYIVYSPLVRYIYTQLKFGYGVLDMVSDDKIYLF